MPRKTGSTPPAVVVLTSSDDDETAVNTMSNKKTKSVTRLQEQRGSSTPIVSSSDNKALDWRSFWKAGNFDFGLTGNPLPDDGFTLFYV